MKINWKERLKNKTFLLSLAGLLVSFIYQLVALLCDKVPDISQNSVIEVIGIVINILALLGVVVDPTTSGISDSARALTYGTEKDVRLTEE